MLENIDKNSQIEFLKNLISNDKIDDVYDYIDAKKSTILLDDNSKNEFTLLSNKYNFQKRRIRLGLRVEESDRNQLILQLIEFIDNSLNYEQVDVNEVIDLSNKKKKKNKRKKNKEKFKFYFKFSLAGISVLFLVSIAFSIPTAVALSTLIVILVVIFYYF